MESPSKTLIVKNFLIRVAVGLIIILAGLGSQAAPVSAVIVYYYDEQGRIHYINTKYMKVPERYRWQVEEQLRQKGLLESDEQQSEETLSESLKDDTTASKPRAPFSDTRPYDSNKVEFFTQPGCTECYRLEMLLRAHKIPYIRYDITCEGEKCPRSPRGIPAGSLPLTRVGEIVIEGKNIQAILNAYQTLTHQDKNRNNQKTPISKGYRR